MSPSPLTDKPLLLSSRRTSRLNNSSTSSELIPLLTASLQRTHLKHQRVTAHNADLTVANHSLAFAVSELSSRVEKLEKQLRRKEKQVLAYADAHTDNVRIIVELNAESKELMREKEEAERRAVMAEREMEELWKEVEAAKRTRLVINEMVRMGKEVVE